MLTVPVWVWSSNALVLTQRGDETPWGVHFYSGDSMPCPGSPG